MSKINNRRKTQKEKKIRKENNNQKVGGQRKEIINKNKATEFYYLTVLYLEFQLVRTPPPLSRMYGALTPRMYGSISKTVVKERGEKERLNCGRIHDVNQVSSKSGKPTID